MSKALSHIRTISRQKHNEEAVDYDYLRKLTPADQSWLAQFTDEYYGGAKPKIQSEAQKKEANHSRHARYYEALNTSPHSASTHPELVDPSIKHEE